MTERKLSTLGYLMDRMGLSAAALARRLHVDASLVSKWRSGSRHLNPRSMYFDDICSMLLEQNEIVLSEALYSLMPLENPAAQGDTAARLRSVLADRHFTVPKALIVRTEALCTAEIAIYTSGEGRRQAISDLLDVAETMETPGELLYVDSEQSGWLMEDTAYAKKWVERMKRLLDRGFLFRIALHFSVSVEKFVAFFQICNPLIFHRNAQWYYHQYYDENIYWFSFFILEHAMSVSGMSMSPGQTSTTVYTDAYSVLQHRSVFHMVLSSCRPVFTSLSPLTGTETARQLLAGSPACSKLFAYLPVPAFIMADEPLFHEILRDNGITGTAASICRELNRSMRTMKEQHLQDGQFIQILQMDEMKRRLQAGFISTSLSLLGSRRVVISPAQYARGLKELIRDLEQYPSYRLLLAAPEDEIRLPAMNCWCKDSCWMVQMDSQGFRLCREPTFCGAASIVLEQGWRRVPPGRKDSRAVAASLDALIQELGNDRHPAESSG